jgi:hypothetical protein
MYYYFNVLLDYDLNYIFGKPILVIFLSVSNRIIGRWYLIIKIWEMSSPGVQMVLKFCIRWYDPGSFWTLASRLGNWAEFLQFGGCRKVFFGIHRVLRYLFIGISELVIGLEWFGCSGGHGC